MRTMSERLSVESTLARAAVIFAGGFLGTTARVGLLRLFADAHLGLGLINLAGCLAIGAISGYFRARVTLLRLFLAVGGVAAFTSWSSLAYQGISSPAGLAVVVAETILGIGCAGLGHLFGLRRRPSAVAK